MKILEGDALTMLKTLPDESIDCCITSPPYWQLRDYGVEGQLGLEETPEKYVAAILNVFREVKRVLKLEGTCWLNLADSYNGAGGMGSSVDNKAKRGMVVIKNYSRRNPINGLKHKDIAGIPWRVAFALQADGWWLRQDIIWHKPNPMPESVTDRCTKSHEYIFLLAKSQKYYFDSEAIREKAAYDGRKDTLMKGSNKFRNSSGYINYQSYNNSNPYTFHSKEHERWQKDINNNYIKRKRSVWTIPTHPYKEAHFATFPEKLVEPMIKAGCPEKGIILDPFFGAGTTGLVACKLRRDFIGIELNPDYIEIAKKRIDNYTKQQILF